MSLAMACGLHKIRTAQPTPAFTSFIDQIDLGLQEPRDQVEEGERINAFWAVFFMDRCSAVVFGPPLVISDVDVFGTQIDTPWPLEMETYERVRTRGCPRGHCIADILLPCNFRAKSTRISAPLELYAAFSVE